MKSAKLLLLLLFAIPLACGFGSSEGSTDVSPEHKIVYEGGDGLSRDIFVIKPDGSEPVNLTKKLGVQTNQYPVWSPDGSKIAFTSDESSDYDQIYVMNADGSAKINVTNRPDYYHHDPYWSPDSTRLAFTSGHKDDIDQIFVVNVDGSEMHQLTQGNQSVGVSGWSPDGTRIILTTGQGIMVMNSDGSNVRQLTDNHRDTWPVWSPDGTKIGFTRTLKDSEGSWAQHIFVINPDGSGLVQLTQGPYYRSKPRWSPDGSKIAFELKKSNEESINIYVIDADGSNITQLTNDGENPIWSPDGRQIAFETFRNGENWDVYIMNADGSAQTRLTKNTRFDGSPDWRP